MNWEPIRVNEQEYAVKIVLENREDSRASIGKQGITIRVPQRMPRELQFRQVREMVQWARHKIEKDPPKIITKGSREYVDNMTIKVDEQEYVLKMGYGEKESSSARIENNIIHFRISSSLQPETQRKQISVLLSRCIAQKKLPEIKNDLTALNQKHFNFAYGKVFLKYNQSNWGSCSSKNNINLSTRLLFAPKDVRDYVCIHELAHLKEKNHSLEFWKLVESAMPNYEEKKTWLKENSDSCWF